jgi:hypothetical protein
VKDTAIDYMHAVLEGVAKTMLQKFWLCGKYKNHRFYLSKDIKVIDKLLLSIKPPHEFRRTPRSIEKSLKYWKASELRAWLLFYSVPILLQFLHRDYVLHLNLLVKSMHILLSSHIASSDLLAADKMLTVFYEKVLDLYPQEICTMNVHSVMHLVETVKNLGPLWSYSCFGFESMNGHLKKHCHGTRNVLPQLARNFRFHQAVLDQEYHAQNHDDGVRGRVKKKELCSDFLQALHQAGYCSSSSALPVFSRYKLNGVLYKTWKDSEHLRNSSVCKFKTESGSIAFGSIHCFCFCNATPVAIMAAFGSVRDAFEGVPASTIPEITSFSMTRSCVLKVHFSGEFQAVPISSIILKCVHIAVESKPFDFIVPLPNSYEHRIGKKTCTILF